MKTKTVIKRNERDSKTDAERETDRQMRRERVGYAERVTS